MITKDSNKAGNLQNCMPKKGMNAKESQIGAHNLSQ